jgi:hypothetical protein
MLLHAKKFLYYYLVMLACFVSGCKQTPEDTSLEYYYFPKSNMYYSVSSKLYYFSLDGGKNWDTLSNDVAADSSMLGEKVIIYAPNDSIWVDNEAHRTAYKGSLYDLYDADTLQPVVGTVSEKPVVKKRTVKKPVVEEEETKKKGLKKFFHKIFGKKKDKK